MKTSQTISSINASSMKSRIKIILRKAYQIQTKQKLRNFNTVEKQNHGNKNQKVIDYAISRDDNCYENIQQQGRQLTM